MVEALVTFSIWPSWLSVSMSMPAVSMPSDARSDATESLSWRTPGRVLPSFESMPRIRLIAARLVLSASLEPSTLTIWVTCSVVTLSSGGTGTPSMERPCAACASIPAEKLGAARASERAAAETADIRVRRIVYPFGTDSAIGTASQPSYEAPTSA